MNSWIYFNFTNLELALKERHIIARCIAPGINEQSHLSPEWAQYCAHSGLKLIHSDNTGRCPVLKHLSLSGLLSINYNLVK